MRALWAYVPEPPVFLQRHLSFKTKFQFVEVLSDSPFLLDMPLGQHGSHSFHIEVTTVATQLGLGVSEVQVIGCW